MSREIASETQSLWQALATDLREFLRSRLPSGSVADDLLQETLLRIHPKQKTPREVQSAEVWVYQIARNLILEFYRNEGKQALEAIDEDLTSGYNSGLAVVMVGRQLSDWLASEIARMPETYREATRLATVDGLPSHEIAHRVGLSLEATRSRIRRGREQLKEDLAASCSV